MSSFQNDRQTAPGTGVSAARPPGKCARQAFQLLAWVLAACVVIQVFLAGLAVFASPTYWSWHRSFVHFFEVLPLVMLVLAFAGRFSVRTRWLTAGVFGLLFLQYATANIGGVTGAFHLVSALLLFWLAVTLAWMTNRS